jgi:amidase
VLAAADPDDPVTASTVSTDHEAALDERGLDGSRLGVLTDALGVPTVGGNDEVRSAFQAAVADLQESGATVVDDVGVAGSATAAWGALTTFMCEGFPRGIGGWLEAYGADAPVHDLEEVVAASDALGGDRVRELETLHWLLDDCPPDGPAMDQARADQAAVAGALDDALLEAGVEALVFPTVGCPAVPLASGTDGGCDADLLTPTIPLASLAGWPEVTVPASVTAAGLPIGLSFLGPARSEATLLRFAYAFEQASHQRREPAASAGVE